MNLLKSWLEKKGYKVKFTGNKQKAVQLAKDFNPSLIIIDVLQSDTLFAIKSFPELKSIPMILMTGHTSTLIPENLPVTDSIEKPFNISLFEQKIRNILQDNVEA
jgi:DNA-binding NtrC family response regulator